MRQTTFAAALPLLLLAGCGGGSTTPGASASPGTAGGQTPWVVVQPGKATPSSGAAVYTGPRPSGLPPVSFLPTGSACDMGYPTVGDVLIPMTVTVGAGSVSVQWPNRYGNTYRVTAVPQDLVTGAQPATTWQTVNTGAECTASATISGLTSGSPYVVWLDAPDTPRKRDGSRDLYSGRSPVVIPN